MSKIRHVLGRASEAIGLSYLSIDFLNFTKAHSLLSFGTNLSNVFVTTFILRSGGTMFNVSLYILFTYAFETLANLTVPSVSNHLRRGVITRLGLIFFSMMYVVLLLTRDAMHLMYPMVAFWLGIGGAYYYSAYINNVSAYTTPHNRQMGLSLMGMTGNLIAIVAPLISGGITSQLAGTWGYVVVFSLTLLAFLLSLLKSRSLPSAPAVNRGYSILRLLRRCREEAAARWILTGCVFFGLRESLFLFYLNILLFQMVGSEMAVGAVTTAKGLAAMGMFLVLGKRLTPRFRVNGPVYLFGIMLIMSVGLAVSMELSSTLAIVMVVVVSIADNTMYAFNMNSLQGTLYGVMEYFGRKWPGEDARVELSSALNAAFNGGRALGMVLFFLMPFPEGSAIPLIIVTALAFPSVLLNKRADTLLRKLEQSS